MTERLIITNGDIAVEGLRAAGIAGDILPWRDVLHDGPVPQERSLEALSKVRARYLAQEFGDGRDVERDFAARDAAIRRHDRYARVELWFEHDLYDQLQLIQILDVLSGLGRADGVFLVQAEDYLGPMSAQALRSLAPSSRAVTAPQFAAAKCAWRAFTADTPDALAPIATEVSPLPYVPAAVRRLIAELPAVGSGLSLTEERTLRALAASPDKVWQLFKTTQEQEDARFLGDTSFFRRLDGLTFCTAPLIAGLPFPSRRCAQGARHPDYRGFAQSEITLTEAGRAALAGNLDHARENGIDRWFGGTHLTAQNLWRRDRNGGIVPPILQ